MVDRVRQNPGEAGAVSESESRRPALSGGGGRTIAIVVAILLAGAMIAGAIAYVRERSQAGAVTTTSAQTAWEYTTKGWRCENDRGKPLNLDLLEGLARAEKALSDANNQPVFFERHPVTCTEPS
jgi:hypothetical protein